MFVIIQDYRHALIGFKKSGEPSLRNEIYFWHTKLTLFCNNFILVLIVSEIYTIGSIFFCLNLNIIEIKALDHIFRIAIFISSTQFSHQNFVIDSALNHKCLLYIYEVIDKNNRLCTSHNE